MRRGFSVPIILVVIVIFVLIPFIYWQLVSNSISRRSSTDVQGISVANSRYSVLVGSDAQSWDLFEYLCQTKSDCDKTLLSGKFNQKISGGAGNGQHIKFISDVILNDYAYLKLFMKPSWGMSGVFKVSASQIAGTVIEKITDGAFTYDVLFIPIESLPAKDAIVGEFSDH